jgi:arabinose-5-phosphate isomerase
VNQTADQTILGTARSVVQREAAVVSRLVDHLDSDFLAAAHLLLDCTGRVVCCGVGKSGIVARKLAASLASLGTPAFFLHAAEAMHGDLGMVTSDDVVVLFSHSGTTAEVVAVLRPLQRLGVPIIGVTDRPESTLAQSATLTLCPGANEEADHLGLAPTASTTAALVLSDALAVSVAAARGFSREDFARTHPGGALGERLAPSADG